MVGLVVLGGVAVVFGGVVVVGRNREGRWRERETEGERDDGVCGGRRWRGVVVVWHGCGV